MNRILAEGTGFIYLVARLGVTGVRSDVAGSTRELIERVKTPTPKAVDLAYRMESKRTNNPRRG